MFNSNDVLKRDDHFVAIYDANEFNITSRVLDAGLLKQLFKYVSDNIDTVTTSICPNINPVTVDALNDLCQSVLNNEADLAYKDLGKERKFKRERKSFTERRVKTIPKCSTNTNVFWQHGMKTVHILFF